MFIVSCNTNANYNDGLLKNADDNFNENEDFKKKSLITQQYRLAFLILCYLQKSLQVLTTLYHDASIYSYKRSKRKRSPRGTLIRGDRGILGHFLENELWLRFFPQIANQSVFKAVSSVPRYFLCPNLFSN